MAEKSVKISVRGFAEVSSAEPKRKQSALRKYQFPESEESVGRSNYYAKALSGIRHHHRGEHGFVESLLQNLLDDAASEADNLRRAKLLHNHRALTDYLEHFGNRVLTIKPGKQLCYPYKNLVVSARPDLVAEEGGKLLLIKLNLSNKDFKGGVNAMLLHMLYVASQLNGLEVAPTGVECLQVSSGSAAKGPKSGFPPRKVLDNACQELLDLWAAA